MTMDPLRIGMIGQKFMGRAHSNAIGQVERFFDLPRKPLAKVVCGRDAEELQAFAERWGWERHTTRWRDLIVDEELDLVDLVTPNHLHGVQAIELLGAGKHVACEKPLSHDIETAGHMARAAKKARGRTFVWFNYRRCPAVGFAWKLIRSGRVGRVLHVRASYLQDWGGPATPMSWRFAKKTAGSGALGDLGAHSVDLARFLTGDEFTQVHGAHGKTFYSERPLVGAKKKFARSNVDDAFAFIASMKGGALATFEASRVAGPHQNNNAIEINGELGSLRFSFEDMNRLQFCDAADGHREGGWRSIMCTSAGDHPYAQNWWPDAHGLGYEHTFVNMLADIVCALGGCEPELPLPDFEDAYQTQRVLAAAQIAAKEGRAVKLSSVR